MTLCYYTPVAGTHEKPDGWIHADSEFTADAAEHGLIRNCESLAFWDQELAGTVCTGNSHRPWEHLADRITEFLLDQPFECRNVYAHSHSGQGMAIAAARYDRPGGAPPLFRRLVTIGCPGRDDILPYWKEGQQRGNIERHEHLYGTGRKALVRVAGQGLLGSRWKLWRMFQSHRTHPTAHRSREMIGGHSGMLREAEFAYQRPRLLYDVATEGLR